MSEFVTLAEASEILGEDVLTVRRWVREGHYGVRIETHPLDLDLIDREGLNGFIAHCEQATKQIRQAAREHDKIIARRMRSTRKQTASKQTETDIEHVIIREVAPIPGTSQPIMLENGDWNYSRGRLVPDYSGGSIWFFT